MLKEFSFLGEKFKTLLCRNMFEPHVTRHPKTKGLPYNRIERTHDVLACNKIFVRTRVQGTFGKMSPRCMSRFSSKEKKKEGKKCVCMCVCVFSL